MSAIAGKRVVVTRASHQVAALKTLLEKYQAIPIIYPCIAVAPPENTTELDMHLRHLTSFDWLLFTSANTVHALADRFHALNLQPDWTKTQIGAVGSKTDMVICDVFGHSADFTPASFMGKSLAETLPIDAGDRVLLPQSELADDTVTDILVQRGATVISLVAYRTVIGEGGDDVPQMLADNMIDIVTFTSPSSVYNFVERIQPQSAFHLLALCIGPTTANAATEIGFTNCLVPNDYTLNGMIHRLLEYFET